ncbi:MAG TPA: serine protease [Candidatus Dormibacteraeota bacterium]|nr:serine protease [Candidatus Dormibacteraeota bacterium]
MRRVIRFVLAGLLVAGIAANGALLGGIWFTREPAPKPLTASRIETASRPAVVLVQANYTVSTSLPSFTIPESKIKSVLVPKLQALVNEGKLNPYDKAAVDRAAINFILANPDAYYVPGPRTHDTFGIVATGSGFFVTEDGYLVTAAHVVSADKADLLAETLAAAMDPQSVAQLRQDLADSLARDTGLTMTDAQLNTMVAFTERWLNKYLAIDNVDVKYYLGTGTVETGDNLTGVGARASVVSLDPYGTGHDVAIMKANVSGASTLQLAAGTPHIGEATYPLGYPRQGYLDEAAPLDQTISATMTTGKVDTTQDQKGGWTAWGTDAQITHGNSGGPVLGPDGKVLGLVSFGEVDAKGNLVPGQAYFVPAQYIRAALAADSVQLKDDPKSLTSTYYHALAEGDIQRYRTELGLLQDIQARTTFNGYIKDDVVSTEGKILSGNDKTPPDLLVYVLPAAATSGGLIVLVLITWTALAIIGRRRKPAPVAVTAEPVAEAAAETPAPVDAAYAAPAVELVASPHEVLRESEPVAAAPPAAQEAEE